MEEILSPFFITILKSSWFLFLLRMKTQVFSVAVCHSGVVLYISTTRTFLYQQKETELISELPVDEKIMLNSKGETEKKRMCDFSHPGLCFPIGLVDTETRSLHTEGPRAIFWLLPCRLLSPSGTALLMGPDMDTGRATGADSSAFP